MTARSNESYSTAWSSLDPPTRPRSIAGVVVLLPRRHRAEQDGYRVVVDVDLLDGRIDCTLLEVTSAGGRPVTGDALRRFPIGRYVDEAIASVADFTDTHVVPENFPKCGPTDEALAFVAHTHRVHSALGRKPLVAVIELGLPRSTAALWVKKAREKGML